MKKIIVGLMLLCSLRIFAAQPTLAGTNLWTGMNTFNGSTVGGLFTGSLFIGTFAGALSGNASTATTLSGPTTSSAIATAVTDETGSGPLVFGTGATLSGATVSGSFSGNGAGFTNLSLTLAEIAAGGAVTNFQSVINSGFYSTVTYGSTNPVDIVNAYQFPQAMGHYKFSTIYSAYTNSANTNILFFNSATLGEWVIATNLNVASEASCFYIYAGNNNFPTNDQPNWSIGTGSATIPASVDVGTILQSNLVINSFSPSGMTNVNLSDSTTPFVIWKNWDGNPIVDWEVENSPNSGNYRMNGYGWAGPAITNTVDAAHFFTTQIQTFRLNGACNNIGGDNRSYVELASIYGPLVVTNGKADLSHVGDLGAIMEFLTKRNLTNGTSVQGGVFMHPLKLDGLGRAMLGNIPEAEHNLYVPANAWVDVREGTAAIPQLLLRKTPIYTGPVTNGFFYSDGLWMHVFQNGSDQYILSGATPNNGSGLTNFPPSGLSAYTATNTLAVTGTGLTNSTLDTYLISTTAGAGMVLKDANGNQFASPPATATFPLKPGWRLSGTAITGMAIIQSK